MEIKQTQQDILYQTKAGSICTELEMTNANFNKAINTINTASSPTRSLAVLIMIPNWSLLEIEALQIVYSDTSA